jgi:hypothetical protein
MVHGRTHECPISMLGGREKRNVRVLLFVPKTEAFDRVSLREPAYANVLVAVCGDDVCLVRSEGERRQEGCVPQDERPS